MTQASRGLLAIAVVSIMVTLSGCVVAAPEPKPSVTDDSTLNDSTLSNQEVGACRAFDNALTDFNESVKSNPPAADWVVALEKFAFAINDQSFKADDGRKVESSLQAAATIAAGLADTVRTSGSATTQENLVMTSAVRTVGEDCGYDYSGDFNFEENPK